MCRVETREYRRKHGLQKKTLQTWSLLPPAYKADVYHKTSCIKLACPFFLAMAPSLQMTTCLGIARGGSREIDEEIIMHDCFFVRSECWFSMVLWFCGLATMAQRAPDTRCSPVVEVSQINTSMVYTHDYTCIYRKQRVFLCIRAFYGKPQPRMLWEACIILHDPACISGSESVSVGLVLLNSRSTPSAERPLLHAWYSRVASLQTSKPRNSQVVFTSNIFRDMHSLKQYS